MILLLTAVLAALGFALGAAGVVVLQILLPVRAQRISTERRDFNNITAAFHALPAPKNPIPSTLRKSWY